MITKKVGTWVSVCIALVAGCEGLRTVAYRDPVGIPTICFGETHDVRMGQHKTVAECKSLLASDLQKFSRGVDSCVHVPMSADRKSAAVSFAYNLGVGGFCRSTFAKALNRHDPKACDYLLHYDHAHGVVLPGLRKRRQQERKLCNS